MNLKPVLLLTTIGTMTAGLGDDWLPVVLEGTLHAIAVVLTNTFVFGWRHGRRWAQRHPALVKLLAVILIALLAILALGVVPDRTAKLMFRGVFSAIVVLSLFWLMRIRR